MLSEANLYRSGRAISTWMGAVNTSLEEEARAIFTDLGYDVTRDGDELRAERKWRTVRITTDGPESAPETGQLRCFVTWSEAARGVHERLLSLKPDYDWAVIAVDDGDGYEVLHPDADVLPAP